MDDGAKRSSRLRAARALFIALAAGSALLAMGFARNGSAWMVTAIIAAVLVGFCAAYSLDLFGHARVPPWAEAGGIAAVLFITSLLSPSEHAMALYLAGFSGLSLFIAIRRGSGGVPPRSIH